jgi:RHS repeat-associated protein
VYDGSASGALYLDTPRQITNTSGTVVWEWQNSDPFGNNEPNENPSGLGAFEFPLRFTGQTHDKETGLNQNHLRDGYNAAIGGYTQSDPIGLYGGSWSTYTYVRNNPLRWVDPFGLDPRDPEPGLESVCIECFIIPAARIPRIIVKIKSWCEKVDEPKPPQGVPENWTPTPTNKGDGTKWTNPDNPHDFVRDMPGNPNSPNAAQQNPYVVQMRDGKAIDVNGNSVSPSSPQAHIPSNQFNFKP